MNTNAPTATGLPLELCHDRNHPAQEALLVSLYPALDACQAMLASHDPYECDTDDCGLCTYRWDAKYLLYQLELFEAILRGQLLHFDGMDRQFKKDLEQAGDPESLQMAAILARKLGDPPAATPDTSKPAAPIPAASPAPISPAARNPFYARKGA